MHAVPQPHEFPPPPDPQQSQQLQFPAQVDPHSQLSVQQFADEPLQLNWL